MQHKHRHAVMVACALLAVTMAPAAFAGSPKLPDPNNVGPYAIGHLSLMYEAPLRSWDLGPRPLPVEVFYPVDASAITGTTPEAIYPLDPINGVWPDTFSEWEPYGNDPAYEGAAPSARRPFPLVLFYRSLCTRCGKRMSVVAFVTDSAAIARIPDHLGLSSPEAEKPPPLPREVLRVAEHGEGWGVPTQWEST